MSLQATQYICRVRSVELEPPVLEGTPALLGYEEVEGRSRVGSFPEARPVLGEIAETLCAAGTEDLRWGGCGCFPRARHTRARAPLCAEGRLWVLSPGEPYPGREPLCVPRGIPGRDIPRARVPFRPGHICVLD